MTLPGDPTGDELAGLIARERYARWLEAETAAVLRAAFERAARELVAGGDALTPRRRAETAALLDRVVALITGGYTAADRLARGELTAYAGLEADAAAAELRAMVGTLAGDQGTAVASLATLGRTQAAAIAALPIEGLSLGQWFEGQAAGMSLAVRRQVQLGLVAGESAATIARRIVLPRRQGAGPAPSVELWRRARRDAVTVVRTATTAVHAEAALATYAAAGGDVVAWVEWLSVLDGRTSAVCRGLSGKRWRVGDPKLRKPPAHPNCRSRLRAIPDARALGLPAAALERPSTLGGYDGWLRRQDARSQNVILGAERAALFRARRLTLAEFLDGDARVLTLAQLRAQLGLEAPAGAAGRRRPVSPATRWDARPLTQRI